MPHYEGVPGYFLHDHAANFPSAAVPPRFGLHDASNERWKNFFEGIKKLNEKAAPTTMYKFFLLSRHGQAVHNLAEPKYGPLAWDSYWSTLDGDGELVWGPDPELTPVGIEQARTVHESWALEAKFGLPPPHIRYSSPLTRALHTASIIFDGTYEKYPTRVIVKENCREENGVHTCDKRHTASHITSRFPAFEIEDNMPEDDQLWSTTVRETSDEVVARAKTILDNIFETYDRSDTFVSVTSHGGFMNAFLEAIGRNIIILPAGDPWKAKRDRYRAMGLKVVYLPPGGVLPLVVKAEYD